MRSVSVNHPELSKASTLERLEPARTATKIFTQIPGMPCLARPGACTAGRRPRRPGPWRRSSGDSPRRSAVRTPANGPASRWRTDMMDGLARLTAALADQYLIERELGRGGMATVYVADDVRHRRKVAIKVLKPELAAVLGAERFVQEITTTAALQHPHILPLFDSGEADGFLYYVMPYVEGETLRSKLDRETQL